MKRFRQSSNPEPVGETSGNSEPIVRLDTSSTSANTPVRLETSPAKMPPLRSHEPDIDILLEPAAPPAPALEESWDKSPAQTRNRMPIGWIVLPCLLFSAALLWSLGQWNKGRGQVGQTQNKVETLLEKENREIKEASAIVDSINAAIRTYFSRTTVDELSPLVRHTDRVTPRMREYYKDKPVFIGTVSSIESLQPLQIDPRSDFWIAACILSNGHKPLITVEVTKSGKVLVDWESLVCDQPMDWSKYAQTRPAGTTMDFYVYAEPVHFHSHEFQNSKEWLCVRLTAYGSIEFLFGYARIDSEAGKELRRLIKQNRLQKTNLILRLTLPEGLQSPRGVLIDKVVRPNWIHLDPPDAVPQPTKANTTGE